MSIKLRHTIEEIDELKVWFETIKDRLPETIQIDSSAYTLNLKETINILVEQAYICYDNTKMQGCIHLLKKIKKNLEDIMVNSNTPG